MEWLSGEIKWDRRDFVKLFFNHSEMGMTFYEYFNVAAWNQLGRRTEIVDEVLTKIHPNLKQYRLICVMDFLPSFEITLLYEYIIYTDNELYQLQLNNLFKNSREYGK